MPDNKDNNEAVLGALTGVGLGAQLREDQKADSFLKRQANGSTEYPGSTGPPYAPNVKQLNNTTQRTAPAAITPADHYRDGRQPLPTITPVRSMKFYTNSTNEHLIADHRQNISSGALDAEAQYVRESKRIGDTNHTITSAKDVATTGATAGVAIAGSILRDNAANGPQFSASVTDINQFDDPVTEQIIQAGTLSNYIEDNEKEIGDYKQPPVSPIAPFTRMNTVKEPYVASKTLFTAYNRTKLPVADTAWRKGFRHIFITRPECYVWAGGTPGGKICNQALNDEDFQSAYTRMPHIIRLLAPYYISGSYPKSDKFASNWNFLLSNSVQGLSVSDITLSMSENVTKSIEGYTVTPGAFLEGRQGSSIDLSFKDTNNLEVFEFLRLWQLYIYKRKKGIFAPPFNGYQENNAFYPVNVSTNITGNQFWTFHPYDRALEYCASLYDIVTNESGTKILYWCKYYGIYPTKVAPTLNNENNQAITDMSVSASFKYHYKLENSNKTLIEFNHDAGLVDHIGKRVDGVVSNSEPWLLRKGHPDLILPYYIGAGGMFTGSPYIVIARSRPNPIEPEKSALNVPQLRFMNVENDTINDYANLKMQSDTNATGVNTINQQVVAYE